MEIHLSVLKSFKFDLPVEQTQLIMSIKSKSLKLMCRAGIKKSNVPCRIHKNNFSLKLQQQTNFKLKELIFFCFYSKVLALILLKIRNIWKFDKNYTQKQMLKRKTKNVVKISRSKQKFWDTFTKQMEKYKKLLLENNQI